MSSSSQEAGGFIHSTLLSPPASSVASNITGLLPVQRNNPLKPGSVKEVAFINYVDHGILHVQRLYAIRFGGESEVSDDPPQTGRWGEKARVHGYQTFREVSRDIERLVEVVWVSGTPSLQVSYLLSLALLVMTYLPSFPPAPRSMFRVLKKLDFAFASLVQGRNLESGDILPGLSGGRGVSETEKVRIKSLIERTRVVVVEVMGKEEYELDEEPDASNDALEAVDTISIGSDNDFGMEIARVYDRAIVELGDTLGGLSSEILEA